MTKLTKLALLLTTASLLLLFGIIVNWGDRTGRHFVILSTNDIHAQIDNFASLATAIEACRDTTTVILVDAGDRWTGNAFVDLVEHYTPIYTMFNYLDYDVTIYGNHEFDKGQAYVAEANRQAKFPIIGANIVSDTTSFPQPLSHYIVNVEGKRIAFVGIVGNYDGDNHPSGKSESYQGLRFLDPHTTAAQYGSLRQKCDMLVLVSHCGLERDVEFAQSELSGGYDQIISGHSHDTAAQVENGILISQTGSRLENIGATMVTIKADGEVLLTHRNIPLKEYEPKEEILKMVEEYHNNPHLNEPIGSAAQEFTHMALKNLFAESIRQKSKAAIGVYHQGGVRVKQLTQGSISMATVLNAEPFNSYIATATMSVGQLRGLVMAKFNDTRNVGEAHCIDLVMTTPYTILVDQSGDAVDVIFHELDAKKSYKVAMGDYIFKTYKGLSYTSGKISDTLITTTLEEYIKANNPLRPNEKSLQEIKTQDAE